MRILLHAFIWVSRLIPVKLIAILGLMVGYIAYVFCASRRRIVARNLRITIDPNLRAKQLRPLVRRNMMLTCMNFACAMKVGIMNNEELADSVNLIGKDVFEEAGTKGNTGIACIPHAGNWEVLARIRPLFTKVEHFGSMYRKLRNPELEKLVYKLRTGYGCEMFSKEAGLRRVIRMTRSGGLIGILSDQYTQEGIYVPYFGKVTGTTPFPSLLKSMSKGRLFAVHTRNRGLGRWDAVLGEEIHLNYQGADQEAANTVSINLALENSQKVSILDGFWMHHRWKTGEIFGLQGKEKLAETVSPFVRLPFRIIIAMPESFDEAILCLPALRVLRHSRFDAQISVICTTEQSGFWQSRRHEVQHVFTYDSAIYPLRAQLEEQSAYESGPFDYLFMWNESQALWKKLQILMPIYISGFEENALSKHFKTRFTSAHCGPVRHAFRDYLALLENKHELDCSDWENNPATPLQGQDICWIAPLSTLGSCEEQWPLEHWQQLIDQLTQQGQHCILASLPADMGRAAEMAMKLNIPHKTVTAEGFARDIGLSSTLIAVDGLIPQLAALSGARCVVMMASRLSKRYRPLSRRVRVLYHHSRCHPCYRKTCDAAIPCMRSIRVESVLEELRLLP